jgi:hypothetical protein
VVDLLAPIAIGGKAGQNRVAASSVPRPLICSSDALVVDRETLSVSGEQVAGQRVDSTEVDFVDSVRGQPAVSGMELSGERADIAGHEDATGSNDRQPGCAVQQDDRLAGTRRSADPGRAVEGAAHEPGLGGMEEPHPVLDGLGCGSGELLRQRDGVEHRFLGRRWRGGRRWAGADRNSQDPPRWRR